jgi:hypothetical protein
LKAQREAEGMLPAPTQTLVPSFMPTKALTIAFATLLVMISTVGVLVWIRWHNEANLYQAAITTPVPSENAPPLASSRTPTPSTSETVEKRGVEHLQKEAPAKRSPELFAANKVEIDLGESNRSRGAGQNTIPVHVLYASNNDLVIRLPAGSPIGTYQVILADPFGNAIVSSSAQSHDGTILRAALKLTSVKAGRYLICITRNAEVPDCVPALIRDP